MNRVAKLVKSRCLSILWKQPSQWEEFTQRPCAHEKWRLVQRSHGVLLFTLLTLTPSNKTAATRFYSLKLHNVAIWGLYVKNVHINHIILWALLCAYFPSLSLTLTVLPQPALNKDNYSGNISANQVQPCILPGRRATSQNLANITGA